MHTCTPWLASTSSSAPWQAASERDTCSTQGDAGAAHGWSSTSCSGSAVRAQQRQLCRGRWPCLPLGALQER